MEINDLLGKKFRVKDESHKTIYTISDTIEKFDKVTISWRSGCVTYSINDVVYYVKNGSWIINKKIIEDD